MDQNVDRLAEASRDVLGSGGGTSRRDGSARAMNLLRHLIILVRAGLRSVLTRITGSYRPELHYMRGPGPRSLAKAAQWPEHDPQNRRTG
jgi:hypothetical protein